MAGTEGQYLCPVYNCNNKASTHTRYDNLQNWHDHLIKQHTGGYHFEGKVYNRVHDLGEAITASQGQIQCKIADCSGNPSFQRFSALGRHLIQSHKDNLDNLDNLPYNSTYKAMPKQGEKKLSQLASASGMGKRYQTRHGHGFVCKEHPTESFSQTPEGIAQHFLKKHTKVERTCPVATCIDPTSKKRPSFETHRAFYDHLVSHQSQTVERIVSAGGSSWSVEIPADEVEENGWLSEEQFTLQSQEAARSQSLGNQ